MFAIKLTLRPDLADVGDVIRLADDVDGPDAEGVARVGGEVLELKRGHVGRNIDVLEDLRVALAVPSKI